MTWRRSGPLAREIPDIFRHGWRRAGKFRNDDGGGDSFAVGLRMIAKTGAGRGASTHCVSPLERQYEEI